MVLQARLERGIADGELAPDTNAVALARFLMTVIQAMTVQARDGASRQELDSIVQVALRAIRLALASPDA